MCLYPEPFAGPVPVEKPVTSEVVALAFTVPGALLVVPAVLAGVGALVVRVRSSHGVARRQVAVLVVPAALVLVVTLAQGAIPSPWDVLAQAVAILLLPLAIGVAVTRHGLYDLDTAAAPGAGRREPGRVPRRPLRQRPGGAARPRRRQLPGQRRARRGRHRCAPATAGQAAVRRGRPALLRGPREPLRRAHPPGPGPHGRRPGRLERAGGRLPPRRHLLAVGGRRDRAGRRRRAPGRGDGRGLRAGERTGLRPPAPRRDGWSVARGSEAGRARAGSARRGDPGARGRPGCPGPGCAPAAPAAPAQPRVPRHHAGDRAQAPPA